MIQLPNFDEREFIERACSMIQKKVSESKTEGVVLGLSGGIDSAVVACLAVRALGAENVIAYRLPSKTTSDEDLFDAKLLKDELDIRSPYIGIDEIHDIILKTCDASDDNATCENDDISVANLKPRIRMAILYYFASKHNYLVLGTGNRTELEIGYFTKFGDGGSDLLPIGDLFKEDVKKVAITLGVPETIINKVPTAGLWPDQTDEKELGLTYHKIDRILYLYLDEGNNPEDIADLLEIPLSDVKRIIQLHKNSEHKRKKIPIVKKSQAL
ncbi:NAD+ synthase [Methanosphaera cuniculi]|uniref:NH(3)-dependent NAD(+) synthetase n=1 Tax=Methanosphaera cuniculi TaxID=1077256 RepID=A0A2A2HDJ0_9EURY|nr:NAD+ synthase [Methanosphaera cuniculi]PAV07304.1 NAD(+) synthetase [Methanosphaera cuniculi]PWL07873.1 NH(3)-dependent NAD(+) synthetase [Methanosphaera cuniculi]